MNKPFAGRLGGNQQLTASASRDARSHPAAPDAASIVSWRESFNLSQFSSRDLWTQAMFEGWGKRCLAFAHKSHTDIHESNLRVRLLGRSARDFDCAPC